MISIGDPTNSDICIILFKIYCIYNIINKFKVSRHYEEKKFDTATSKNNT